MSRKIEDEQTLVTQLQKKIKELQVETAFSFFLIEQSCNVIMPK